MGTSGFPEHLPGDDGREPQDRYTYGKLASPADPKTRKPGKARRIILPVIGVLLAFFCGVGMFCTAETSSGVSAMPSSAPPPAPSTVPGAASTVSGPAAFSASPGASQKKDAGAYEYYYTRLTAKEQGFYRLFRDNTDSMQTGRAVIGMMPLASEKEWEAWVDGGKWNDDAPAANEFYTAEGAFLSDHPGAFYLDPNRIYVSSTTMDDSITDMTLEPEKNGETYLTGGLQSAEDVGASLRKLNDAVNVVANRAKKQKNVYQEIRFIHNYLIDNVTYEETAEKDFIHTAYGALVNKSAVCDGYAFGMKMVLDRLGIPCVVVNGDSIAYDTRKHGAKWAGEHRADEYHAWNEVMLNGKWYALDTTWSDADEPVWALPESPAERYEYFLKGSETFGHTEFEPDPPLQTGRLLPLPKLNPKDPPKQ